MYVSTDGGFSWNWSAAGLPHQSARTLSVSPDFEHDRTLFTSNYDWVYRSTDAGATWTRMNGKLRVDNAHQSVRYEGGWAAVYAGFEPSLDNSYHQSNSLGDTTELRFFGDHVAWYGHGDPELGGGVAIRLDGEPVTRVELSGEPSFTEPAFSMSVPLGWHTLAVINAGTVNDDWTGSTICSDGFGFAFPGQP